MREINTIASEIVELSEIKSAYNHFLASHLGQVDVENATSIHQNKAIVSERLKKLYVELEEAKVRRDKGQGNSQKAKATSEEAGKTNNQIDTINEKCKANHPPPHIRSLRMKFEPYHATELEERAILLFNSDRRYSITE